MARDKKKRRSCRAAAEAYAKESVGGSKYDYLKLPDDVEKFKVDKKKHNLDIFPYEIKKSRNHRIKDEVIPDNQGYTDFKRDFFLHKGIGGDGKKNFGRNFICLKTFGKACPACEKMLSMADDGDYSQAEIDQLKPKHRQLFNVRDRKTGKDAVWDVAFSLFGKKLHNRLENQEEDDEWDRFVEPVGGMYLSTCFEEKKFNGGTFYETTSIDFKERKEDYDEDQIYDEISVDLDEILVELSPAEIKKILASIDDLPDYDDEDEDEDEEPKKEPKKRRTKPAPKSEPKDEEEEEDGNDDSDDTGDDETTPTDNDDNSSRSSCCSRRGRSVDTDEEEEEDEEPKKRSRRDRSTKSEDEDEDEDEKPSNRRSRRDRSTKSEDEDEDEDEKPSNRRSRRGRSVDTDDEEDEEEEEDEKPSNRRSRRGRGSKTEEVSEDSANDDDEDEDNDEDEVSTKTRTRRTRRSSSEEDEQESDKEEVSSRKEGRKANKCPFKHEFGVDTDDHDDCDECDRYEECLAKFEKA